MTALVHSHNGITLWHADCLDALALMPDNHVDSIVCDPPYGLGFMGKAWDDLPPGEDWARECLRVLKPGGHLLAFGGTRTWHRLAVAIEDAGFEIRDSIAWLYGSGFPKSLDVSKAIDKTGGNPLAFREFARAYSAAVAASSLTHSDVDRHLGIKSSSSYWAREDHRGGMPPRHHWNAARDLLGLSDEFVKLYDEAERSIIGQKTSGIGTAFGDGQWAQGVAETVNITAPATPAAQQWQGWGTALKPAFEPIVVARKPLTGTVAANVQQWGTGALNIDGCRVGMTDADRERINSMGGFGTAGWTTENGTSLAGRVDGSLASLGSKAHDKGRWPTNVVLDGDTADALDEHSGPVGSNSGTPTRANGSRNSGGIYSPGETGTSQRWETRGGGASRFFPTFRYQAKAPTRERPKVDGTAHATVKPLELMRWLVRLVTPPDGIVLEPFAGSGTTVEAAILEGMQCIAIEREADYLPLILERIRRSTPAPAAPPTLPVQPSLFGDD